VQAADGLERTQQRNLCLPRCSASTDVTSVVLFFFFRSSDLEGPLCVTSEVSLHIFVFFSPVPRVFTNGR
jgi:hypothetical protein